AGSPPQLRLAGLIRNVEGPAIDLAGLRQFATSIAPQAIAEDLDGALFRGARFSRSFDGLGRFRCALYSQRSHAGLIMHVVTSVIGNIAGISLTPAIREITQSRRGLTIVTGPSGSGKSTTMAALIDQVNETIYGKIVTLEDPIEVLHPHKKALVAQ